VMPDTLATVLERPEARLATALLCGLLVGTERERHKGSGLGRQPAGLRTFTLTALLGCAATMVGGDSLVAVGGLFVAVAALVGYALGDRTDPGLTSEVALLLTYTLGVLSGRDPILALTLSLVATAILVWRNPLHRLVRRVLTRRELQSGLALAMAAVVVLPRLPDRTIDPFQALNPFTLWRLVVLAMTMGIAGHVAERAAGPRLGLLLAGFASGFVSSAATVAAMAGRALDSAALVVSAAAGATASCVATFVYMALLIGTASPVLLATLSVPLAAGAVLTTIVAVAQSRGPTTARAPRSREASAFRIGAVLLFALLVAVVTIASAVIEDWLGSAAVVVTAGVAGLADAHATAAGVASLVAAKRLPPEAARYAVLLALTSNAGTKLVIAWLQGPRAFAGRVTIGVVVGIVAAWLAVAF